MCFQDAGRGWECQRGNAAGRRGGRTGRIRGQQQDEQGEWGEGFGWRAGREEGVGDDLAEAGGDGE